MKVSKAILSLQETLLVPEDLRAPRIGAITRASFDRLAALKPDEEWALDDKPIVGITGTDRDISADGLKLVKHFEGLYLKTYRDEAGVLTIGWGHTGLQHNDGTVFKGREITEAEAEQLLRYDMNQFEARVSRIIKVPLNDDQFSALVTFDFNTGGLTLDGGKPSTLTRKLNAGDYEGASAQFPAWNKVKGKVVRGLTRRRASERNLFDGKRPFLVED